MLVVFVSFIYRILIPVALDTYLGFYDITSLLILFYVECYTFLYNVVRVFFYKPGVR